MTHGIRWAALAVAAASTLGGCGVRKDDAPSVAFLAPVNCAKVGPVVVLEMRAKGFAIEAASAMHPHAGHFHVLVDIACLEPGLPIPTNSEGYEHFGDGQLVGHLELAPGRHTLCLQVGDGAHVAQAGTDTIAITVREPPP
jgi:hypothetical protein